MTKKEFKDRCNFHVYTGWNGHRIKHNVIYFDHNNNGFKYAVALNIKDGNKAELINVLYDWVVNGITPPWYVRCKYAISDEKRFKVGLSLNF
jgi:hypothetical protein